MKRITTVYPRDRKALSALSRCGYVNREQLSQFLRNKRIESYCKDGLIEKSIYSQPGSKASDQEVYRLTSKGRDFCRRELSLTRLYSAQNPAHDLVLADRYFSLSESERETWQTETQSREIINAHIRQLREQGEEEKKHANVQFAFNSGSASGHFLALARKRLGERAQAVIQ